MQAPPPQQPRRPKVFAPIDSLSKLKHHSEGLVLHLGENIKVRENLIRDLQSECVELARHAHQAMQDPRLSPLQKEHAARDVESLKASLNLELQALAINKQFIEDVVQTEFMNQSIAQRWVAGLPPDFSILGPVMPPQPPTQTQPEPQPEPQPDQQPEYDRSTSLSSSLANPNWPEPAFQSPQATPANGQSQNAEAVHRPITPPHRIMPMPRAPAIMPQRPQAPAATETQTDPLPPEVSTGDHPRTAS